MALSNEDKHDVKTHLGKALANKVSKVTKDSNFVQKVGKTWGKPVVSKSEKKEPVQISKEYHNGKWQKVGFYEGKGGKMSIKPYKTSSATFTHQGEKKTLPVKVFKTAEDAAKQGYSKKTYPDSRKYTQYD